MSRAPITVVADGLMLRPADAYAQEQIAALPLGVTFIARLSKLTRKGKEERDGQRGLWWAGLGVLSENTESRAWDTPRKAHDEILRGLGFVRPRYRIDKTIDLIPVSTKEENMDDEEFAVLFERARALVVERFGFDPWDMWAAEKDAAEAMRQRSREHA